MTFLEMARLTHEKAKVPLTVDLTINKKSKVADVETR